MKKLLFVLCACVAALLITVPVASAVSANEFDIGPELLSAKIVTPTTVGGGDEVRIEWRVRSTRDIAYGAVELATGSVFSPQTNKVLGQFDDVSAVRDGDIVTGTTSFTTGGPNWASGEWRVTSLGFFDELDVHGGASEKYSAIIQSLPKLQIDVGIAGDQEYPELVALEVAAPDEVRKSDVIWFNWTVRESSRVTALSLAITGPDGRTYQAEGFNRADTTRDGDFVSGALHLTVNNFTWSLGEYRVHSLTTSDEHQNEITRVTASDNDAIASAATFTVIDSGGPDITAPELRAAGFEQTTVRMGDQPHINWTIRDESSMDDVTFYLESNRGRIYQMRGYGGDRLGEDIRGTAGAWLIVSPLEDEGPAWHYGEYRVIGADLTDDYGNHTILSSEHTIVAGLPRLNVLPENAPIPPWTPSPTVTAAPSPTVTAEPSPAVTVAPTASHPAPPSDAPWPPESTGLTTSVAAPPITPFLRVIPTPSATAAEGESNAVSQTPALSPGVLPERTEGLPDPGDQSTLVSRDAQGVVPWLIGAAAILAFSAALLWIKRRNWGR